MREAQPMKKPAPRHPRILRRFSFLVRASIEAHFSLHDDIPRVQLRSFPVITTDMKEKDIGTTKITRMARRNQ